MSEDRQRKKGLSGTRGRLILCIALVLLLVVIAILLYSCLKPEKDPTETVLLDFNGGVVVFDGGDIEIVPDMEISREFYIKNESTCEVFYRIYIDNLSGPLATYLIVTISDKDGTELYNSLMTEFTKENVKNPFGELGLGEKKEFLFKVYCPKDAEAMGGVVDFDIKADAVQTKDNPDGIFG